MHPFSQNRRNHARLPHQSTKVLAGVRVFHDHSALVARPLSGVRVIPNFPNTEHHELVGKFSALFTVIENFRPNNQR